MCGIVGIVHRKGQPPVRREPVRRMCDALAHRGPDDEGLHVAGGVGLGMRRLSIIDVAGGHQPIYNEDRSKVIVFNGEIYNYQELRQSLVARGHHVMTRSDTETVVHLYEDHGADCLRRLRGMFALAIWDETARTLLLARDRFGIKPLYVVTAPWGIAFASELKALWAAGLAGGELDWGALDAYFRLGYIPAPRTPFASVRKLEPAEFLLWRDSGELERGQYWQLPDAGPARPTPDAERRVLEWIDESVAAHQVSDVPIAAFLSGGLDSSAVVSSVAAAGGLPHAYVARFHGSGADGTDETPLARALADRYGVPLTVVDVEPNVRDLLEPIVTALDEPHADESALPTWLISEAVAREYKVAMVGTGGDELFAGYRRHLGLGASESYGRLPGWIRGAARRAVGQLREPRAGGLGVNRLKRFVLAGGTSVPERYLALSTRFPAAADGLYTPGIAERTGGSWALESFGLAYRRAGAPAGLRAALALDYFTYLPDDLLHLSDRIGMRHSLEIRPPFVDHRLVEQVFPLPDAVKIGMWRTKRLLRRALRGRLPAAHFRAPKRGFVGPAAAWLRHELRPVMQDELGRDRLKRLGFFQPDVVARLVDDHLSRRHNRSGLLWELLCFSTWHRIYVEAPSAPAYAPDRSVADTSHPAAPGPARGSG